MQGVDQQVVAPVSGRSVSLPETILASHISNGISTLPVVDSLHDHDLPIESESKVRGTMRRALNSRPALKFNRESTTKGTVIPRTCIVRIDRLIIPESTTLGWRSSTDYEVCIAARIRHTALKDILRSTTILIPHSSGLDVDIDLDFEFVIEYLHKLKSDYSCFQLILQKRKLGRLQFKDVGYFEVSMENILQMSLDTMCTMHSHKSKPSDHIAKVDIHVSTLYGCLESGWSSHILDSPVLRFDQTIDAGLDREDSYLAPIVDYSFGGKDDSVDISQSESGWDVEDGKSEPDLMNTVDNEPLVFNKIQEAMEKVKDRGTRFIGRLKENMRRRSEGSVGEFEFDNLAIEALSVHDDLVGSLGESENSVSLPSEEEDADAACIVLPEPDISIDKVPVTSQLEELCIDELSLVVVVDGKIETGRQLWDRSRQHANARMLFGSRILTPASVVVVYEPEDVQELFSYAITAFRHLKVSRRLGKLQPSATKDILKFVMLGGDWLCSSILRPYVDLLDKEPRGWQDLGFYLVPLEAFSSNSNVLSSIIASNDFLYKSLFFSSEWKEMIDRNLDGDLLELSLSRYVVEPESMPRLEDLPIAGSMIELRQGDDEKTEFHGKSVPFLRDVFITPIDIEDDEYPTVSVDYWLTSSRKKVTRKISLLSLKVTLQSVDSGMTELGGGPTSPLNELLPSSTQHALNKDSAINDEPVDLSGVKPLRLDIRFAAKDPMGKFVNRFSTKNTKRRLDEVESFSISRVVLSVKNSQQGLNVRVDDIPVDGASFISVSGQWGGRCKSFPIAMVDARSTG